jgi:hypothetical protein
MRGLASQQRMAEDLGSENQRMTDDFNRQAQPSAWIIDLESCVHCALACSSSFAVRVLLGDAAAQDLVVMSGPL